MSHLKRETYRINFTPEIRRVVMEMNQVLARLEDRLDIQDGTRTHYFCTYYWEQDHVREEGLD